MKMLGKKFLLTSFLTIAFCSVSFAAAQPEPSGADIEHHIEEILAKLQKEDKSETINRLVTLATQIKAMNDARHEFSEALKIILVNLMKELEKMGENAKAMDAIRNVVGGGKIPASAPNNNQAEPEGLTDSDTDTEE